MFAGEAGEDSPCDEVAADVDNSESHHACATSTVLCNLRQGVTRVYSVAPALVSARLGGAGEPGFVLLLVDVELVVHEGLVPVLKDRQVFELFEVPRDVV